MPRIPSVRKKTTGIAMGQVVPFASGCATILTAPEHAVDSRIMRVDQIRRIQDTKLNRVGRVFLDSELRLA